MRWEHCKSRHHFLERQAKDGQKVSVLWPREANPPMGWEGDPKNQREGILVLGGAQADPAVEFQDGSRIALPPRDFWFEIKEP